MTDAAAMHPSTSGDASAACLMDGAPFVQRKPWQRFCSAKCRNEWNALRRENGLHGTVSSVRLLRDGRVSVTLRFAAADRDRITQLEPGRVVELV